MKPSECKKILKEECLEEWPEHFKSHQAIAQAISYCELAQDYLALDDKLSPEDLGMWFGYNGIKEDRKHYRNGYNNAIHRCRLRYLKNMMSAEEISGLMELTIAKLLKKAKFNISIPLNLLNILATAIFNAFEKKMKEEV